MVEGERLASTGLQNRVWRRTLFFRAKMWQAEFVKSFTMTSFARESAAGRVGIVAKGCFIFVKQPTTSACRPRAGERPAKGLFVKVRRAVARGKTSRRFSL